jgi:hypothetical protein
MRARGLGRYVEGLARDLHAGSLCPICFDVEATKAVLPRELMEVSLRSLGRSEDQVIRAVDSACVFTRF